MKLKIFTLLVFMSFNLLTFNGLSQCEPMSQEECPDPENNGQVCPDSLEMAFINQFYSQVATIKPPAFYYLPPDSTLINLHHVKLMEVGNLPEGLNWQSNTADSVFIAGEYYCVLLEGTPVNAGEYPLDITVDVYVLVFGIPVKAATVTDSTSLTIQVVDNSGIYDGTRPPLSMLRNAPNPFRDETSVSFCTDKPGPVVFEVYSAQGKRIHHEKLVADKGENTLVYDGRMISPGLYFYQVRSDAYRTSGMMIRSDH